MCLADHAKAVQIAENLVSIDKYPNHGSVINHLEAQSIGLNVDYLPYEDDLWQLLWRLYIRYSVEIREKSWVKIFESKNTSVVI